MNTLTELKAEPITEQSEKPTKEIKEYTCKQLAKRGWTKWLDSAKWSHWVTLTFRGQYEKTRSQAHELFREWEKEIGLNGKNSVHFVVFEYSTRRKEHFHIHCLLFSRQNILNTDMEKAWYSLAGIPDVQHYIPHGGASGYLADKLVYKDVEYLPSHNFGDWADYCEHDGQSTSSSPN
jgi:hypothetical protein